ncbi:MAG TPA: glycoside hydrolase family 78 protein [Verrucomicrobiae bacterium]
MTINTALAGSPRSRCRAYNPASLKAGLLLLLPCLAFAKITPEELRCEYLVNPLGIDSPAPRLSWICVSGERAQRQSAYQILVASSEANLKADRADLWDTGQVNSSETAQIAYRGTPLASGLRCYWKVRVWDQDGKVSGYAAPAFWELGLLAATDWKGQWIGRTTDTNSQPAPLLRRAFEVNGKVKRARAYVCGLGYYELRMNGKKIGDHLLDPGYTRYDRRALSVTYDVADALRRGQNAVGVILGNGWFNVHTKAVWNFHKAPWRAAPKLLMQLAIEYDDGRTETVLTDASWKTSTGPIVFDSIYGGETYDARLEKPGWDTANYNDSDWSPARIAEAPAGRLAAQMMPPIKADQSIRPVKISEPRPGVFVFDMGQNFAGFAELNVRGPAGAKVVMKYGERLAPDGMVDRADIQQHIVRVDTNQQFQTDTYILKGSGNETWRSRFTYHGFQYIEVTGFPGKPSLDNLRGVFIHSAIPVAGEFECSNPLFNKIWRAGRWAYLSNLQGIPTDCPHREKNGWTGDAHLAAEQGLFNYEPQTVYTKWINDLGDEQRPTGELPGIVPTSGWGYEWGNGPAWDSAFLLIPYYLYEYSGDTRVLRDQYPGMKRYVDYLTSKAKNGIVSIGLNDWAPWKTQTPADITSTAYYYRDAQIVALAAKLLGRDAEAQQYGALATSIRKAFNQKFYHPETATYGNGSQTSLSCALYQGLAEDENGPRVFSNLVAAVEQKNNHIDTGILGAKYILNALTEYGRADLAYRIANQTDQPSWGWWIGQGATTLWEQWNGTESRNHIMFGDISAWFYKALAGINPDPAAPGFRHVIIQPQIVGDLTSAKAAYNSVRGLILSEWKLENGLFTLHVIVPANTSATVRLPVPAGATITEGGKPVSEASGVERLEARDGHPTFEVGSGDYVFTAAR